MHEVRDVAPNKIMLCLTFTLTPDVAFADEGYTESESKRARTGDA